MAKERQTEVTEQMIASVLPIGARMTTSEMIAALGVTGTITPHKFGSILKAMRADGFVGLHRCTNRPHQWYRLREPVQTGAEAAAPRDDIERVAVGGSRSGHYGSSDERPSYISLPKMPALKSMEAL